MKDIMANGYRAGGNVKFFGKTPEDIRTELMKRLNMDDTSGDEVMPSMLAFPMSAEQYENGNMDIAMSITSRYLPYEVAGTAHKSFPGGEAMYKKYDGLLGLRAVHFGEDLRASENMEYMSQVRSPSFKASVQTLNMPSTHHSITVPVALRARQTMRSASRARTASTIRSTSPTPSSSRAWATGAPTRAPATRAGAAASRST